MSTPPSPAPAVAARAPMREPAHRVSPRAPWLWAAGTLIPTTVLVAGLYTAEGFDLVDVPWWGWTLLAVAAVAYGVAMPLVRYRVHRWESTDSAVYTQSGWLARERRVAPMSRVQTVDFQQTAVGRLFGVASVTVTTASAAGPVRIDGISREDAERLVEELTLRAEADPGDAT